MPAATTTVNEQHASSSPLARANADAQARSCARNSQYNQSLRRTRCSALRRQPC